MGLACWLAGSAGRVGGGVEEEEEARPQRESRGQRGWEDTGMGGQAKGKRKLSGASVVVGECGCVGGGESED